MAEANQQLHHDWSQVLQLVVPYIDTRAMHARLSIVSQHMQHVMQTHIRQQTAGYLKQFRGYGAWLPSTDAKKRGQLPGWGKLEYVCPAVKWLCRFAGAEAMGTAAVATAVLSDEQWMQEGTARMIIQSGLRLSDESVAAAAAAAHQQVVPSVTQQVPVLLQATPPERAGQHSGLTPLMRFACTAGSGDPMPSELWAWAEPMSQQQLFGVLLVMAGSYHSHDKAFRLLLDCLLLKQQCPESAHSSSREATPLQDLLVQLLRASLHGQEAPEAYVPALVCAICTLPSNTQQDPNIWLELLQRADNSFPAAIPYLAALPGIQSLPQEVFYGLLCTHTHPPYKQLDYSLEQLLKLPHAQHISGSQLSRLLAHCISPSLMLDGQGVHALLSLPAAEDFDSREALKVLKIAAAYDGRLLARAGGRDVQDSKKVWGTFERLAWHLTVEDAVGLFQHVIQYRWHDLIPDLMSSEPLMMALDSDGPTGLATVIEALVTSGLWLPQHSIGADKPQLQDQVLELEYIQDLDADHTFAMMEALADLGCAITPVVGTVNSAMDISSEQVAMLLKRAMDNVEWIDVCNLAICPAAAELETKFLLEMVTHLLAYWPVSGRSFETSTQHTTCCHLHSRQEALASLLKLPAAERIREAECVLLATTAAKAGSLGAFIELCRGLPQLRSTTVLQLASGEDLVPAVARMYQLAVDKGDDQAAQQLTGLAASQHLSTADLQPILLQAIAKATRVHSSLDPSSFWDKEGCKKAEQAQQQRDTILQLLLGLPACRTFTPYHMLELLQSCIVHGAVSTARALLQEPSAQQMNAEQLEQLLLTQLSQEPQQYKNREEVGQLLGLLLQLPAAAELVAAALSRLIRESGPFAAAAAADIRRISSVRATNSERMRRVMQMNGRAKPQGDNAEEALDPVELLVGLPVVQQYDGAGLAAVLAAAAEAGEDSRVIDVLCRAPAAAALSTAQLRQLLQGCAQHYNAGAFSRLLQHPAAPDRGDSQVQLYAGMLGC